MSVSSVNSDRWVNLFESKSNVDSKVLYKKASHEDCAQVQHVFALSGLKDEITTIEQPCHSAELNSQNFVVTTKTSGKLLIRRCQKLKGLERYTFLHGIFEMLKKEGVNTPAFYSSAQSGLIYLEISEKSQKVCWVFFKHIQAIRVFSGESKMIEEAAEQIGKMHVCLKKCSSEIKDEKKNEPCLPSSKWEEYKKILHAKANPDTYDQCFLRSYLLIESAIKFVEENASMLSDPNDLQLIHFDLNSSNFIIDERMQVNIMDFDELKIGNVYSDIAFALHRLVATCVEHGNKDINHLVNTFVKKYQKGNPTIKIDDRKLKVAMYDRALRNINANLSLKYIENSQDWLTSIPLNIRRLEQVVAMGTLFA